MLCFYVNDIHLRSLEECLSVENQWGGLQCFARGTVKNLLAETNRYEDWQEVRPIEQYAKIRISMESELRANLRSKNWRFSSVSDIVQRDYYLSLFVAN